jgi:predicted Rossmann fold nucleotide-binding protein DprA/Smf involved in DNA uptake
VKLGIVGSRDFGALDSETRHNAREKVREFVQSLPRDWTIVSGGAIGPDTWAVEAARALGMPVIEHLPQDDVYSFRQARLERNKLVVRDSDAVVAFWDGSSAGTMDAVRKATAARKRVYVVRESDPLPVLSA